MKSTLNVPRLLFWTAICLSALGGIAFAIGIAISFTPGNSGGGFLTLTGMTALGAAVVTNFAASAGGLVHLLDRRQLEPWFPISVIASMGSAIGMFNLLRF